MHSIHDPAAATVLADRPFAPTARVLDLGCGAGAVTARLVEAGCAAVAADRAQALVRRTARRTGADAVCADAAALPFPDASFDGVAAVALLPHLTDPDAALAEMRRVLRPDGQLVVATWGPLADCPLFAAYFDVIAAVYGAEQSWAPGPFTTPDVEPTVAAVVAAGFDRVHVDHLTAPLFHRSVAEFLRFDGADPAPDPAVRHRLEARLARWVRPDGLHTHIPIHRVLARRPT